MHEVALYVLPYLSTVIGFLIVYVLNGIKTEIKEVKGSVNKLESEFRNILNSLEHRVSYLEFNQKMEKNNGNNITDKS